MNHLIKPIVISSLVIVAGFLFAYNFIQNYEAEKVTFGTDSGYDLTAPAAVIKLPKILREISGLCKIDAHTVAAVQDEDGEIFFYDLRTKEIVRKLKFDKDNDYEGIACTGDDLYVLRSDGKLFEVRNFREDDPKVEDYKTDIPVKDNEGLTYDPKRNRLLIAGKSEPKGDKYDDKRAVFAFDLDSKKVNKDPAYIFDEEIIENFVKKEKPEIKDLSIKINPSGIAVHPLTDRVYVLSGRDNFLYIFNHDGTPEGIFNLSRRLFKQAEGIAFSENGEMLIANEGGKGKAVLLRFDYRENEVILPPGHE